MTRGFRSSLLKPLLAPRRTPFLGVYLSVLVLLLAASALAPSLHAQSASAWNKRGQAAELKQDYDTAYEAYKNAHEKAPKDMRYTARMDRMRFQASAQHVDRGRVLRQNGDITGALNSFSRALVIDPGDDAARQEIEITERSEKIPGAMPIPPSGTASSSDLVGEVSKITGPVELKPISSDLIQLNIGSQDVKTIYQGIGKLAGINVLFDDGLSAATKRIPVVLNGVSLADALYTVGLESNTFYKALTPDTIFVADNTPEKHRTLDDQAVQTFYLTNAIQQNDINEIATTLRTMFPQPVQTFVVGSQDAIVMRAPPQTLMLVQKMLNDLDRTKAEVVVDVAILEVNRDKVRNLGISLPQSFSITPQVTPNSTNTVSTATTAAALASNFTLNTLANINATNFAVTISGGTLNALLSDADTRVLQNPNVRATDNTQATLKIGTKVPVANGTLSSAVGGGIAGGLAASTTFTYQDVGVTIDMKPQIHLDRQVSLTLDIADTTEAGSVNEGNGVTQPIFGQREIKDTIQLRDGEPCLLAGLLSKTDNNSVSGTPGLASIPLLKYIFGSVNKEVAQDEIVFVLVPHIVRESVLTQLNTRAVDTGTSGDVQIRKADAPLAGSLAPANPDTAAIPTSNITAAQGAAAMVPQIAQQATRTQDVASSTPGYGPASNPTSAGPATPVPNTVRNTPAAGMQPLSFSVTPASSTQAVSSEFDVAVVVSNAQDIFSVPLQLQFDPKVLQLVNVNTGSLLGIDGQPVALVHRDEGNGLVTVSASRPPGVAGVTASGGPICVLHFRAVAPGDSTLALVKVAARNSTGANLPATGSQAVVHVR